MKILALSAMLLFTMSKAYAQCDSLPLSITIKVDSAYTVKYSKKSKFIKQQILANNYVVKSDSVKQTFFNISLTIKNTSDTTIGISLMTCSWQDNFIVNNNYMFIEGEGCDSNFPTLVEFKPGESKVYKTRLVKSMKFDYRCKGCTGFPAVTTTKLGLIILNDVFGRNPEKVNYFLGMEDKSAWTLVWSNALYLLSESEANPKPLEFGIGSLSRSTILK